MARGQCSHAAFLLHQAAERYFHAALLVFIGYKPRSHNLEALFKQTEPLHEAMAGALPRGTPQDEHLFDLLNRAYIDARYSKAYRITREELVELLERVRDLARRAMVEASSLAQLESLLATLKTRRAWPQE